MPVKTKAKDHSKYMRYTTHHNLTHIHHKRPPLSNAKKVLYFLGIVLFIAIICIGCGLGLDLN